MVQHVAGQRSTPGKQATGQQIDQHCSVDDDGTDNQPPLQMLTDTSHPTKQEISLIYKICGDTRECRKLFLQSA